MVMVMMKMHRFQATTHATGKYMSYLPVTAVWSDKLPLGLPCKFVLAVVFVAFVCLGLSWVFLFGVEVRFFFFYLLALVCDLISLLAGVVVCQFDWTETTTISCPPTH